jgi:hypothetical protein
MIKRGSQTYNGFTVLNNGNIISTNLGTLIYTGGKIKESSRLGKDGAYFTSLDTNTTFIMGAKLSQVNWF